MSAQKPSASTRPLSALGAILGFISFAVLAGILVTIGVTPAIAVAGVTTNSTIGIFQSLPEYIEIGDLPQRNELYAYQNGKSVHFATVYDQNREEVSYDEISPNLRKAAVDGEDRRFWEHGGVDLSSLVRAGIGSVAKGGLGDSGGGSTLTMQLVRNIKMQQALEKTTQAAREKAYADATETSISRKLEEIKLAIGIAKKYSKKQILTGYLNIAYFGDQAYGVQAAAQHYYNKDASDLTPAEAASLIAIVQSPNTRNLSSSKYYDANVARRNVILKSMLTQKSINEAEYKQAIASSPADYVHLTPATQGCQASVGGGSQFFCDYAVKVVKEMKQLGTTKKERAASWRTGGYKIQTTLDLDLTGQQKSLLDKYDPNTESRFPLGATFNSIEANTGRILTMAQNKDYDQALDAPSTATSINYSVDEKYGGSIGFQTGSTYKLFTLLDWLEKGHGLNETVNGTPHWNSTWTRCDKTLTKPYKAQNDSTAETGYYSVINATAQSINAAYLSMAQQLDLCDIRDQAVDLGVHLASGGSLDTYPASVLGTNNIAPMTMASAYATIANNGVYCTPIAIDSITSPSGKNLGGQTKSCKQVISPSIAETAAYALKRTITSGTAVGAQTADGAELFAKTGTTDNADQIWLVGGSTRVATAYWQGSTKGSAYNLRHIYNAYNSYAAQRASVWEQAQAAVNTRYTPGSFTSPTTTAIQGTNTVSVPDLTGKTTADAQSTLAASGLTYVDGGTQTGSGTAGTVLSTSPAAGTAVSTGASVTVYSSDGTQTTVPDVSGESVSDAESALTSSGFTDIGLSSTFQQNDDDNQQCTVASLSPGAGTSTSKDTTVTLTLYGDTDGNDPGDCQ